MITKGWGEREKRVVYWVQNFRFARRKSHEDLFHNVNIFNAIELYILQQLI